MGSTESGLPVTGPNGRIVSTRFIGLMSLISSLVVCVASMSVWGGAVMLAITALPPLLRPFTLRSRWRVVLADTAAGLVLIASVYYMRSLGMSLP